jgi:hypothetical protein
MKISRYLLLRGFEGWILFRFLRYASFYCESFDGLLPKSPSTLTELGWSFLHRFRY